MHRTGVIFKKKKLSAAIVSLLLLLPVATMTLAQGKWVCATSAAQFSVRQGHEAVVFQDKLWVLNGYHQKVDKYDIWNSSNGKDWTKVADNSSLYPMHAHHPTVSYNGYIWILGGQPGC